MSGQELAEAATAAAIPHVTLEMLQPAFWIDKMPEPDKLIMNGEEIAVFNKSVVQKMPATVYNLTNYPSSLKKEKLTRLITKRPFPDGDRYVNGIKADSAYYEKLKRQMNLPGIKENNEVLYALTVKRTNIRTFPTSEASLSDPGDLEFDMFQETAAGPAEPALVLHRSLDGGWYFVQIFNYCGWIPAGDAALAKNKAEWLEYINAGSYLVVTGSKLRLGYNAYSPELSELELGMGAKIPLAGANLNLNSSPNPNLSQNLNSLIVDNQSVAGNYVVKLPIRGGNGELIIKNALIPKAGDVSIGYLPYTRANIIRQAFKIQGERYGWGGMFNGRDCSAYVMDVYKSFGFLLPRNSDEQERSAGRTFSFASLNTERRYALLNDLPPGATLHTPTHVMLYLGIHKGRHYIIHDVASLGDVGVKNPDGSLGRLVINEVVVTDLSLPRRNGRSLIDSLTSGKLIENENTRKGTGYNK
jgi:hypothetical protein